jgi:SAM-dependent methyltransferase
VTKATDPAADFQSYTYSAFPQALYRRFVETYLSPFSTGFREALDLGCGSGGLLEELQGLDAEGSLLGVDVSAACIEACRARPSLQGGRVSLLQADAVDLARRPGMPGRFDLVASYSVLHLVPGDTPSKMRLLADLTRPGALLAVDALCRIPWNRFMFGIVKGLIATGLWGVALRVLGPFVGPSFPKEFLEELARMRYLRRLRYQDFLDLEYLRSEAFQRDFQVLRLDVLPQDGFFTGRKARLALRRRGSPLMASRQIAESATLPPDPR